MAERPEVGTVVELQTVPFWNGHVLAQSGEFLARSELEKDRQEITVPLRLRLWTDDYNSLLPILRMHSNSTEEEQ